MKKIFLLLLPFFFVSSYGQNFPVAVADSAQVMNQKVVSIFPLLNDYDPDGDTIEILKLYNPGEGESWYEDSTVYYQSEWFEGWDDMIYKVAKVGQPGYQSNFASIHIEVLPNPDIPVAVEDSLHAKYLEETILFPLHNDYDPNGDAIVIEEVEYWASYCDVTLSDDSTYVIFTSEYAPNGYAWFDYRIIERNTSDEYFSLENTVRVYLDQNEDLPITVDDSYELTGGISTALNILENDYNPLDDTLEIFYTSNPAHGSISIENDTVFYTGEASYTGKDEFEYNIRYKNQPHLYAQKSIVELNLIKNPDCPIGVPDFGSGMSYSPIAVEVISNDYDPNGDTIVVYDVKTRWGSWNTYIYFLEDSVIYTSPGFIIGTDTAFYKIRKKNSPSYSSEWIPIIYDISHNPEFPLCRPDSAITYGGISATIDVLANDIIPDSIYIDNIIAYTGNGTGSINVIEDSIIQYTPFWGKLGFDTISYFCYDYSHSSFCIAEGKVYVEIKNIHAYDSVCINNINAGVNSNGFLFTKANYNDYHMDYVGGHFEYPKGSGINSIFMNTIWLGGYTWQDSLHLAGQRYYITNSDFQAGPVSSQRDSAYAVDWQRSWKLTKDEVNYHRNNWWKEGYEPIDVITKWPGNGDPEYAMADRLAPFFDNDHNSIYEPIFGDYPLIRGDECILFFINDDKEHEGSGGDSLRAEMHCMVYSFDAPQDSVLYNTVFVHYDLINRSENTYYDTYFSTFTHFSIGAEYDDYLGSSVLGNSFFAYNGRDDDGGNSPSPYDSISPPAQSVTYLAGPFMDPDNEDNPRGGCDYSVNGLNFDNGIIDDERVGLSYFLFLNDGPGPIAEPKNAEDFYRVMRGSWRETHHAVFGGFNGWGYVWQHPFPDTNLRCRYMFPGDTDPLNWGTDCVLPNGGYNQNGKWWTEEDENHSLGYNRKGMGSVGPFTFKPGDVQEVDMAYVFANSYHSADSSKNLLLSRLMDLRQRVLDGEIIIPNEELDVNEYASQQPSFEIYPNPARDIIYMKGTQFDNAEYRIINTLGTIVQSGSVDAEINISALKPGMYVMSIVSEEGVVSVKMVKR